MCWGVRPGVSVGGFPSQMPMQPIISRDLLRTVCEPFFEQMLTAVQYALQEQMLQAQQISEVGHILKATGQTTKNDFLHPSCQTRMQTWTTLDPMLDEESTEADDFGAFASLLSGPSSETEVVDGVEATSPETEAVAPQTPGFNAKQDVEVASDSEKTTMVCRHWKTKGWCRMESNCKFLHPEHKRGITAPKGCTNDGCISGALCPGISTMEGEVPAAVLPRRRKRGGRNRDRSSKAAPADVALGQEQDTGVSQLPGCLEESHVFYFQCTNFV